MGCILYWMCVQPPMISWSSAQLFGFRKVLKAVLKEWCLLPRMQYICKIVHAVKWKYFMSTTSRSIVLLFYLIPKQKRKKVFATSWRICSSFHSCSCVDAQNWGDASVVMGICGYNIWGSHPPQKSNTE